jgi:hypothetical protein
MQQVAALPGSLALPTWKWSRFSCAAPARGKTALQPQTSQEPQTTTPPKHLVRHRPDGDSDSAQSGKRVDAARPLAQHELEADTALGMATQAALPQARPAQDLTASHFNCSTSRDVLALGVSL